MEGNLDLLCTFGTLSMLSNIPGELLWWGRHSATMMACWFLHWNGLPLRTWPKKGLSTAVYNSRAGDWNYLLFEKYWPRTGRRISNLSLLSRGPLVLEDKFKVLTWLASKISLSFERERKGKPTLRAHWLGAVNAWLGFTWCIVLALSVMWTSLFKALQAMWRMLLVEQR